MSNNRTHFIVDAQNFSYEEEVLFTWESLDVLTHLQNAGDAQEPTIIQWNEDGILADFTFSLDNTKNVSLLDLAVALVASDGTNTFELDRLNVNLVPNVSTTPIINVNDTRGYILPANDDFNKVEITTGATAGSKTFYNGVIAQKITWQEWLANANVPAAFIDLAQENDGLNQKADNYSGVNGYDVYIKLIATVSGTDSVAGTITQEVSRLSDVIEVYDYGESDDGVIISGTIETFDSTGTYNLGGSYFPDQDTLFKVTWVGSSPLLLADIGYVIHRIEQEEAPGNLEIEEISSFRGAVAGGKLENIQVVQSGADIVSTCIIKAGSLASGNWKLSARIQSPPLSTSFGWILLHMTNPNGKAVVFEAKKEISTAVKTFISVNSATVSGDYSFYIGDTGADLVDANAVRWATFSPVSWPVFSASAIPVNTKVLVIYTGAATDTDILTAIKVGSPDAAVASLTNTLYINSSIAASDVLLPFQTAHTVNAVTPTNTSTLLSEVRTDAEILAGQNLTDFTAGIGALTGLGANAYGHLFIEAATGNSSGGTTTIQTTATVSADGNVFGIGTPLQNYAYPQSGTGVNPLCVESDLVNDQCYLTDATDYIFNNTAAFESWSIGQKASMCFAAQSGLTNFAASYGIGTTGASLDRYAIYGTYCIFYGVSFGASVGTDNRDQFYRNVFVFEKTGAQTMNVKIYVNGYLKYDQTKTYNLSTYSIITSNYNSTKRINLQNPSGGQMMKKTVEILFKFDALTDAEIRDYALGSITFTPDLHWDFQTPTGATVPELVSGGTYDATLYNHTNLRNNYF